MLSIRILLKSSSKRSISKLPNAPLGRLLVEIYKEIFLKCKFLMCLKKITKHNLGAYSLPVPNSNQHQQRVVDTILEAWSRVAASGGSARARVKVDRP
tara:strand:- start:472 stop:765 length:294 start_codon:yes stop_codon:yes gene_type:complete